jgi:hypothetical protein
MFDGQSRISILPAAGVDRLSDDVGLQFVEQLLQKQVKCLLVRDRDALTEDWMKKIASKSKRPMFIWPMDCIESYLVLPSVFRRILVEEIGEQGAPPLNEIESQISSVIAGMYDETEDRVAARFQDAEWRFNHHNRVDAAQANPVARAEMDKNWKKAKQPLILASGKAILTKGRDTIQKNWKVSFGNARIIEVMQPSDVHQDIKDMLAEAKKVLI